MFLQRRRQKRTCDTPNAATCKDRVYHKGRTVGVRAMRRVGVGVMFLWEETEDPTLEHAANRKNRLHRRGQSSKYRETRVRGMTMVR